MKTPTRIYHVLNIYNIQTLTGQVKAKAKQRAQAKAKVNKPYIAQQGTQAGILAQHYAKFVQEDWKLTQTQQAAYEKQQGHKLDNGGTVYYMRATNYAQTIKNFYLLSYTSKATWKIPKSMQPLDDNIELTLLDSMHFSKCKDAYAFKLWLIEQNNTQLIWQEKQTEGLGIANTFYKPLNIV